MLRYFLGSRNAVAASGEIVHSVIYSEPFTENDIEPACREKSLEESYEAECERYAFEIGVPFDCADYFRGYMFRFQNRDNA